MCKFKQMKYDVDKLKWHWLKTANVFRFKQLWSEKKCTTTQLRPTPRAPFFHLNTLNHWMIDFLKLLRTNSSKMMNLWSIQICKIDKTNYFFGYLQCRLQRIDLFLTLLFAIFISGFPGAAVAWIWRNLKFGLKIDFIFKTIRALSIKGKTKWMNITISGGFVQHLGGDLKLFVDSRDVLVEILLGNLVAGNELFLA